MGLYGRTKEWSTNFFPQKISFIWQPRPFRVDCSWCSCFSTVRFNNWYCISCGNADLNLWFTASSGLSASMLQLHKMHSRHGTISSIILWQTHLQRLQIQLQTPHSNNLHSIYRGVSSNIRALLCTHRFHSGQSGGFCGSFSGYNLQRPNVANKKTLNRIEAKSHCSCKSKNREILQPVVLYLSCFKFVVRLAEKGVYNYF